MTTAMQELVRVLGSSRFRGAGRLTRWAESITRLPEGCVLVDNAFGFLMVVEPAREPVIDRQIYLHGAYEFGTMHAMTRLLYEGDTVLDIGANIGQMAVHAANLVGPRGRVLAFEPARRTHYALEGNLTRNGVGHRVEAFRLALSDTSGRAFLSTSEDLGSGGATIIGEVLGTGEEVHTKLLDEVIAARNVERVDFVKLDVEGAEASVIRGGASVFGSESPPIVCMEYSNTNAGDPKEALELLHQQAQYDVFVLVNGKNQRLFSGLRAVLPDEELPVHDNIFCIPARFSNRLGRVLA